MEKLIIRGRKPLQGEILVNGAKNAALGVLAAAILSDEDCCIENLPNVNDINVLLQAIEKTGARVDKVNNHKVVINGSSINACSIDYESIKKIRASYYLLGALLGKYKKAEVALPGGCNIGNRPIDQHIKGFEALGATVKVEHGMIVASAEELIGTNIYLDVVSVGATINIMLAAILAKGTTTLENAAKEPHIVDVANFLNSMGADIKGAGTDIIKINGVESLHSTEYMIIPDQIEAGTFMVAAAITGGDVVVKNIIPKHMEAISAKLIEMGVTIKEGDEEIRVMAKEPLKSTHVKTLPYPGFPTDMQPQMTALLCLANGTSIMTESIFENRFKYIDELSRMGANVKVEGNSAIIDGIESFSGAEVNATDLRAGAALVLAGLAADGITSINNLEYIDRGYESIENKLNAIGADIARLSDEKEIKKFKLRTCS
ncbi:UDP-N-acetylglucosamine 1-carboxyvinyltransferase [Natranaerovirga hydrolytica]|uniref:UDP-N-acetylglucosamine 1-carboxyvinyltransferase n=1 Tax=Natranaerovirga hydrolytica TaxID=680378 RepID=A0A4R1MPD9_9FIRM|nr:UDP-N-acetylglucosamine 1-carboxyvinyltransferase [Natranaerovirga hydrolytica]TCK93174.1 UDP-N-acetylglucosamine 1-carboxyvinyltransferase [Natranaerovirga hydrolytica]